MDQTMGVKWILLYIIYISNHRYIYIMEGNIQAGVIFKSKESKQELLMVLSVHFSPKSHRGISHL